MAKTQGSKMIANNKKAYHDYFILDTYEAGISLAGTEVKALRMGEVQYQGRHLSGLRNGEMFIYGWPHTRKETFSAKIKYVRKYFCMGKSIRCSAR